MLEGEPKKPKSRKAKAEAPAVANPSPPLGTCVIFGGKNLEQLRKLPDACVHALIEGVVDVLRAFTLLEVAGPYRIQYASYPRGYVDRRFALGELGTPFAKGGSLH